MKLDDSTLTPEQYIKVKAKAEEALREAGAFGVYPTPVNDLMTALNVKEVKEDVLNIGLIEKYRKKAGTNLKKAIGKVLGLFDAAARLIFIDRSLHVVKQTFIRLHEIGHSHLPWQRDLYAVIESSKMSLDPELADLFDREANVFASEVLFQLDDFSKMCDEQEFGIKAPMAVSKKYGASIYSSVRRYVRHNHRLCTVVVLNKPELVVGHGFTASLRRIESSDTFKQTFGELSWGDCVTPDHTLGQLVPLGKQRMSGKRSLSITDLNGDIHECVAESFTNTYQVFVLIHSVKTLTKTSIIMPSVDDLQKFSSSRM